MAVVMVIVVPYPAEQSRSVTRWAAQPPVTADLRQSARRRNSVGSVTTMLPRLSTTTF
jgi:hypothetical protein